MNLSTIFFCAQQSLRSARRIALAVGLTGLMASLAAPALAQDAIPPPQHAAVDVNGVDLISGAMSVRQTVNSIGPNGPGGLSESFAFGSGFSIPSMFSYVSLSPDGMSATVSLMGRSQVFSGTFQDGETQEGNTLSQDATAIVYALADGTVARFQKVQINYQHPVPVRGKLLSVRYPSGETLTFTGDAYGGWMEAESSLGYYMSGSNAAREWDAVAANLTQGGCVTGTCSGPTFANQQTQGRSLTKTSGTTVTITNPAGGTPKTYTILTTSESSRVTSVNDGAGTWTYSYLEDYDQTFHPDDYVLVVTVTDPLGNKRTVRSRSSTQKILSDKVGIKPDGAGGDTTTFQYDTDNIYPGLGRLVKVIAPEGNTVVYVYDTMSNVVEKRSEPKPGSGLASTSVTASYNTSLCASIKVCNRPDWIKDERGAQTDFTYDPVHGGVLTVTKPAGPNGVRPQTRYTYGQFTPRYIQNSVLTAAAPVWRLTQTSTCATLAGASGTTPAACVGTADETVTSYAYEPSNVANNVRLLSVTTRAGDNSLSATTSYAYDARGDVIAVDGPLPGTADTTRTYYDASRWKTGVVGPDPDGSGALLYRATRTTYAADGRVTSVEAGTATNQSDATLASFVSLQQNVSTYDGLRRKIRERLVVSGGTWTRTDYGYDAAGRQICQTVRMNSTLFGSTTDACTLETTIGDDGPDRITRTDYDNADRVAKVTSGYLAPSGYVSRVEKSVTYTGNGQEQTVADGKGNRTTYEYDGFDRLAKVRYPNAACCDSSTTDYEQYGYDAAGNRTSWRRRDGTTVAFTYDALNRANNGLRGEAYAYDNLGRRTSATHGGNAALASFDALGRTRSETINGLAMTYDYDLAGRRTQIKWPDNVLVTYTYDNAGEMTGIWQGGAQLTAYGYDNLGRMVSRANGGVSLYEYDPASRLSKLTLDQTIGTDKDQVWTFAYNAAGQVKTRTASNSLYEWSAAQVSKSYTVNGLNQYATAAGTAIGYDGRGNLANDGTSAYGYDLLNNLTSAGSAGLTYEPSGRLWSVVSGGTTTLFLYAGADLVAEINPSAQILRRYVPGAGIDAPVVWYEGSTTTAADRRWLAADPQGSIVSVTTDAGAVTVNTYDEYGIPGAFNQGRFQYTGQAWIPEIGLYHYKARAYSPTLGRFLQTDPIGYGDGLNWYAYVDNDPLNRSDPTGTQITSARFDSDPNSYIIKDESGDGGAQSMPISGTERSAVAKGDLSGFYSSRARRGDDYGILGEEFGDLKTDNLSVRWSQGRLIDALLAKHTSWSAGDSGAPISLKIDRPAAMKEYGEIRQDLARAYVRAVDQDSVNVAHNLSAGQIRDFHWQVFEAHGLSRGTFGGTPYLGAAWQAPALQGLWCFTCDRK